MAIRVIARSKLSILLYNGFDLHMKSPTFKQMVKEGVLFMSMSFKILLQLVNGLGEEKVIT